MLYSCGDRWCSWCALSHPGVWSPVFLVSQSFPLQDRLRPVAITKPVFLVFFGSSRCMIAGVPVGPFFSGSVEACGYGKAGVPGLFFLIQVYDRHLFPCNCFSCLEWFISQLYFTLSIWLEIPFLYFLISGWSKSIFDLFFIEIGLFLSILYLLIYNVL